MLTMKQIAAKLDVSRSAVSLVLNGRTKGTYISEATRRRIIDAAKEMGYQPNQIARAVAMGQTKVIGFLGETLHSEYTARMLSGVLKIAQANGYLVKVLQTGNGTSEQDGLHMAIQQCLSGIICVHCDEAFLLKAHEQLSRHSIPVVILDHTVLNLGARLAPGIRVLSDDEQGLRDAIAHLAALGHSRLAFVSAVGATSAFAAREGGYRRAMRKARLPVRRDYVLHGKYEPEDFRQITLRLLGGSERPSAIVCVTDHVAMVVLRTAREAGLRVPEDLSVVGFADLDMAQYADPPLTTVAQPFTVMGEIAAKRLLAAIEGKSKRPPPQGFKEVVPTRLIVRESTGPANRHEPKKGS